MGWSAEQKAMSIAAGQLGLVSREQCQRVGLSKDVLRTRLQRRAWVKVHRGVYAVGPSPLTLDQRDLAALLYAGPGSALCSLSAARRHKIIDRHPAEPRLLVPHTRGARDVQGMQISRTRGLDASDVTRYGPIRLTKVGRTMLDLSAELEPAPLRAALDTALRVRRSSMKWISQVLDRAGQGHRGAAYLRELLDSYRACDEVPDSELESFAMELGLFMGRKPVLHYDVMKGPEFVAELDLAWPRVKLAVELDSWRFHGDRAAFERDRARDRELAELGWQVLRYVWRDVTQGRDEFVRQTMRIYDLRAARGSGHSSVVEGLAG